MTWEEISRELFEEKTSERFTVDSDGKWWDRKSNKYVTIDYLFDLVEELEEENQELKQYKEAIWNWDSSKIIRVNKNTGEVDLIDKELES